MPKAEIGGPMRNRPERYEETVGGQNPPETTGDAPAVVAGLWYYLAPLAIVILTIAFALLYWGTRYMDADNPAEVAPTTGVEETLPGGQNPTPKPDSTEDEIRFRGER